MMRDLACPIIGPYPTSAREAARTRLRSMGYDFGDRQTTACAESGNTPLWQRAVANFLTVSELEFAKERAKRLVALAQTKEGRSLIGKLGSIAAVDYSDK